MLFQTLLCFALYLGLGTTGPTNRCQRDPCSKALCLSDLEDILISCSNPPQHRCPHPAIQDPSHDLRCIIENIFYRICIDVKGAVVSNLETISDEIKRTVTPTDQNAQTQAQSVLDKLENNINRAADEQLSKHLVSSIESLMNKSNMDNNRAVGATIRSAQNTVNNRIAALLQLVDADIIAYVRSPTEGPSQQLNALLNRVAAEINDSLTQRTRDTLDKVKGLLTEASSTLCGIISKLFRRAEKQLKAIYAGASESRLRDIQQILQSKAESLGKAVVDVISRYAGDIYRERGNPMICSHLPLPVSNSDLVIRLDQ